MTSSGWCRGLRRECLSCAGLDEELAEPWDRSSLGRGMAQEAAQSGPLPSSWTHDSSLDSWPSCGPSGLTPSLFGWTEQFCLFNVHVSIPHLKPILSWFMSVSICPLEVCFWTSLKPLLYTCYGLASFDFSQRNPQGIPLFYSSGRALLAELCFN